MREGEIIRCNKGCDMMTTDNEMMLQNQTKEDYETLKKKLYTSVSEYRLSYLHFSKEKHNKHKSKFMNVI